MRTGIAGSLMMPPKQTEGRVLLGTVAGARGLQGEVRIKAFTANPEDIAAYGAVSNAEGTAEWKLKVKARTKEHVIARMSGVGSRTQAEALKGTALYVARDALPEPEEDEFYYADLIGLATEMADGTVLGTVKSVEDHGAGEMLEIAGGPHKGLMVPFTREAVPVVDLAAGRVVIDPPAGLLEPAEPELREKTSTKAKTGKRRKTKQG